MLNLNQNKALGDYRADIDGLRAVAVLAVVFYHYHIGPFSGGFVGVDVFFVISGYLITRLIYIELSADCFSIKHFYERRIRRIFPALFALLFVATILALLVLFPRHLQRFAESLWATATFVSNVLFWQEAGYFDADASLKPLLHTWSLAVEEQFYLIWPTILFALTCFGKGPRDKRILLGVCIIFAVSFVESVREVYYAPASGFYLLPSRMWELMIGAVVAVGNLPRIRNPIIRDVVALVGLALIAGAVWTYSGYTRFPGLAALAPCVGAALLIYTGEKGQTALAQALSAKPLVFIGLISYSLYLWHWPLYVYANYLIPGALSPLVTSGLLLLSVLAAYLSYRFIEQPFRSQKTLWRGSKLFRAAGVSMAMAIATGLGVVHGAGLPQRYPLDVQKLLAERNNRDSDWEHCFDLKPQDVRNGLLCGFGDRNAPIDFVLWGDSHAEALLPAFEQAALALHRQGLIATRGGCPPLLGVDRRDLTPRLDVAYHNCRPFNDAVARVVAEASIREVVLASRWTKNVEGTEEAGDNPTAFLADDQLRARSVDENKAIFLEGLQRTLDFLRQAQKKIVIIGPIPDIGTSVPEALAKQKLFRLNQDVRPTIAEFKARQDFILKTFAHLSDDITVAYPDRVLCAVDKCAVEKAGIPFYGDSHHLSTFGAQQLTALIASAL